MTLPDSLVVGRLRLLRGIRQDDALTTCVFEPRSLLRRQDPGILFVLIDLLGETSQDEKLAQELMDRVQQVYDRMRGSTTRRLRWAILAANRYLRRWNRDRKYSRQAAGITCVALVGDELYLAQAGPALAVIAQPGSIERFPSESPWLSEEPLEEIPGGIWTPLGIRDDLYVDLNYARAGPGYTLFLASAHLIQLLPEDELALLLDQDPEDILRDLTAIASGQNLSALVVGLGEPEPAPSLTKPVPEESTPGWGDRLAGASRRGTLAMASGAAAILGGVASVLEGLLPDRVGDEGVGPSERRRQAYMWLAIVIPVALTILTLAMYWTRGSDSTTRSLYLIQSASDEVNRARALAETDPGQARELLLTASRDLERVLDLQPVDAGSANSQRREAQRLQGEVQSLLDRIDGVVRLEKVVVVTSLPGTADDERRLVVQGTSAYVFNRRENVVYRIGLGIERVVEVLRSDESRGEASVGPLVDIAWMPAGGVRDQDSVIALDSTGTAWEIDRAGNVTPLRVAGADDWQGLRLVGGFAGNLYVVDVGAGQVLKYSPTVDGYALPPVEWLAPEANVDLKDVVDIAIDGAIYLLRSSGRVEKLEAGEPVPFDQPDEFNLSRPVACFAKPPSDSVFVGDTTRVLQFDTSGSFLRQLLPPDGPWQHLSALWVDEANERLYAVDAGRLVMATLP